MLTVMIKTLDAACSTAMRFIDGQWFTDQMHMVLQPQDASLPIIFVTLLPVVNGRAILYANDVRNLYIFCIQNCSIIYQYPGMVEL